MHTSQWCPYPRYTCMFITHYYIGIGDLEKAALHMETFHHLSRQHKWHTDSVHDIACEHLRRIYTSIAEQVYACTCV